MPMNTNPAGNPVVTNVVGGSMVPTEVGVQVRVSEQARNTGDADRARPLDVMTERVAVRSNANHGR